MFYTGKKYHRLQPFPFGNDIPVKCYTDSVHNFNINVTSLVQNHLYSPYIGFPNYVSVISFYQFYFNNYNVLFNDLTLCNNACAIIYQKNGFDLRTYCISNSSVLLTYNNFFHIFISNSKLPTNPFYINSNSNLSDSLYANSGFISNLINKSIIHYPNPIFPPSVLGSSLIDKSSKIVVDTPFYFNLNHEHQQGDKNFYLTIVFGLGIKDYAKSLIAANITDNDDILCNNADLYAWYLTQYANITGKIIE